MRQDSRALRKVEMGEGASREASRAWHGEGQWSGLRLER